MNSILESVITHATQRPLSAVRLSLRPPLDSQSNRLYDLWVEDDHWIVKEFLRTAELQDAPRREFCSLQLLAPFDIAPRPIFYDPALAPIVIYEYMPGTMWDRRRPSSSELAQLAELWLKMSALPTGGLWESRNAVRDAREIVEIFRTSFQLYADWTRAEFPQGQRTADLCMEFLASRRAVMTEILNCAPRLCFCRADPRFANVIARPDGRLGMIDWEDSGLRDPARDLADLMTHPNQEDLVSEQEWRAFLEPYLAVQSRLDPDIGERMELYLGVFPLFWLSALVRLGVKRASAGQLAGWTINALPANERLRRYLNRALAWRHPDHTALNNVVFFPDTGEPLHRPQGQM